MSVAGQDMRAAVGSEVPFQGRALVVDDELSNRVVLRALLKRQGYLVVEAANGLQAVEQAALQLPDVVFMDVMMPGMDGYEAATRIKALAGDRFIPIIFLTALTDEEALARCIEAGGDDFLTKPFSHTLLRSKIRAMGRIRALHQEVNDLYNRMRQEEEIAQEVFSCVVAAGNVALDVIRAHLRSAAIFSGDLLLTARAPSGDLHVLLGDFTGHGLSAALGALPTADVFRTMTTKGFAPDQILAAINRKLHALLPTGMFLAAQFVRISRDLEHVQVCNRGLPEGLVLDGENGQIRERIPSTGLPLGILEEVDESCPFRPIRIRPGDRVLLVSDGVTEAHGADGDLFGHVRFEAAIATGMGSDFAIDAIRQALEAFCGEADQVDDISLVEIPCVDALFAGEYADPPFGQPDSDRAAEAEEEGEDAWEVTLMVRGRRLGRVDPVPLVISQIRELEGDVFDHGPLFTVLSELFRNALEHGVLELDNCRKADPDGFEAYFQERERRLARLREGYVRVTVRREPVPGGWQLCVQVEDSGKGFDYEAYLGQPTPLISWRGRGIPLVRALCESLCYSRAGRVVQATFRGRG